MEEWKKKYMDNKKCENQMYLQTSDAQREYIYEKLRENGMRITKQREAVIDIILEQECASCKEIYYRLSEEGISMGLATIYRMLNLFEEIGIFGKKNAYRVFCDADEDKDIACKIEFEDHSLCSLSQEAWHCVLCEGLRSCGYYTGKDILHVHVKEN